MRHAVLCILFLLTLLPATPALAFGNCLDPGYLERLVPPLAPQACDDPYYTSIRARSGTATLRVARLSAVPHGPTSDWLPQVQAAAERIGLAMDALGAGRLPEEITLFLSDAAEVSPDIGEVHAQARLRGGECLIQFYKTSTAVGTEEFIFVIAHEIFHCVQDQSWSRATARGADRWWTEGSADYFAHLAVPERGLQAGMFYEFDRDSLTRSLTEMDYQNVVFFAWIGDTGGPAAVGAFLDQMRPGNQISVLQRLVPEDRWIAFVEAWLDGQVTLPGGQTIDPGPMATGVKEFAAPDQITLSARPYVIDRWGADFPEDQQFNLTQAVTGDGRLAMRKLDAPGTWADPPARINTCGGAERHLLYLTTTTGLAEGRLNVDTRADAPAGACCLIGAWSPTQETLEGSALSMMENGGAKIAMQGMEFSCRHASGGWVLTFDEGGNGNLDFEANTTACTMRGGGGAMQLDQSRSGQVDFGWEVLEEGKGRIRYNAVDLAMTITMHIAGRRQQSQGRDDGPPLRSSGFTFSCEGDDLKVRGLYPLSTYEGSYVRFSD